MSQQIVPQEHLKGQLGTYVYIVSPQVFHQGEDDLFQAQHQGRRAEGYGFPSLSKHIAENIFNLSKHIAEGIFNLSKHIAQNIFNQFPFSDKRAAAIMSQHIVRQLNSLFKLSEAQCRCLCRNFTAHS